MGSNLFAKALQKKSFFLVESLVDASFEVNHDVKEMRKKVARDRPADFLVNAIENDEKAVTQALNQLGTLNAKNRSDGCTALHVAAYGNSAKVVEFLIQNGADKLGK